MINHVKPNKLFCCGACILVARLWSFIFNFATLIYLSIVSTQSYTQYKYLQFWTLYLSLVYFSLVVFATIRDLMVGNKVNDPQLGLRMDGHSPFYLWKISQSLFMVTFVTNLACFFYYFFNVEETYLPF